MKKAIIHGETHETRKDREAILEHDLDRFDAIFVEHRTEDFTRKFSILYILFISGYFGFTKILVPLINNVGAIIEKLKLWKNSEDLEKKNFESKIRNADAKFENNIDTDLEEFYQLLGYKKYVALLITLVFVVIPALAYNRNIFFIITPLVFFASSAALTKGGRDNYMARSIIERAGKEQYEDILVICGDSHVEGIQEYLVNQGWNVEKIKSNHWSRLVDYIPKM